MARRRTKGTEDDYQEMEKRQKYEKVKPKGTAKQTMKVSRKWAKESTAGCLVRGRRHAPPFHSSFHHPPNCSPGGRAGAERTQCCVDPSHAHLCSLYPQQLGLC